MHQSNLLWTWVTILLLTFVGCSSDSASNGSAASGSAESGSAESAKAADRSAADRRVGTVFAPTVEQRRILGFENPASQDWVSANATLSRSTTFAEGSSALSIQLTRRRAEACSSKLSLPWKEADAIGFRLLMQDPVSDGEVRVVLRSASDSEPIELAPFALDEKEPRVFHQVVAPLEHQVRTLEAGSRSKCASSSRRNLASTCSTTCVSLKPRTAKQASPAPLSVLAAHLRAAATLATWIGQV